MLENNSLLRQVRPLAYILATITAAFICFIMTSSAFAAAPTMTATTSDTNHDGTVDVIVVTFSESSAIIDGNAGDGLPTLALGNGCTIAYGVYASAGTLSLALNNLTGCTAGNTGLTPSVTYTAVASCGTPDSICDAAAANQMSNGRTTNATDGAPPIIVTVGFSSALSVFTGLYNVNEMDFTYSEPMTITNGASSSNLGDTISNGVVAGIGSFASLGSVTTATGKNTVGGNGTSTIFVQVADRGTLNPSSTTAPSMVFTAAAGSTYLTDAVGLQVNNTNHPMAGSSASWDLGKPTISSVTISDAVGSNGRVDRATLVFSEVMRDNCFVDADGLLGGATHTGTFATGTANDATTVFNLTADTLAVNTAANAADFTYSAATTKICDHAGNRLSAITPGSIVTADAVEVDGANPVVTAAVLSSTTGTVSGVAVNRITFTYSETMTISGTASTSSKGDMTTAGTIPAFGGFSTPGDMTVPTTKNTIGGNVTPNIYIEFADQAGGYMTTVASPGTVVGGTFTPVASPLLTDGAALQVNAGGTVAVSGSGWDLTRPTVSSATIYDAAGAVQNGRVDRAIIVFDSAIRDSNATAGDFLLGGASHTGGLTTGTANDATTQFDLTADTLAVDTSTTTGQLTYTGSTTHLTDLAGNLVDVAGTDGTIVNSDVTELDGAAPVLMTLSPVNGAVGVLKNAVVTATFSEIVASMTYSVVGATTANFTKNTTAAAVTLTPIGAMSGGYHAFTILTAPDAAANVYAGVASGAASNITNPFHFTVVTSANVDTIAAASYTMLVTAPNGGEALVGGATKNITWSSSQTNSSAMNNVNISYTTDNGATYTTIATNEANDGTYSWTVPNITASQVFVKVAGTDLVTVLATDSSDSEFSISNTTAPSTGTSGISPVTGLVEDISTVAFGDYIKSPSFDTVYYVDHGTDGSTLIRRPFNDHQTFITYQANFNNVITVTDATLPTLSLGAPMMPKPGVVLVKIQTVNKVYAIGTSGELRWVTTEALASSIYGSNWSNYVIDLPDTLYSRFTHGSDITTDENIDVSGMKTRTEVNM